MIRTLTSADHAAFRELRLQALQQHPVAFATSAAAWAKSTPERTTAFLKDSESPSPNFVLGSFADGQLTGMIGLRRESRPSVDHKGSIWGFFVRPEGRRAGTGRALLEEALVRAAQMEMRHVRIVTATSSVEAIALFEAQGFERYGLEPGGIKDAAGFHDQVFMLCLLGT